MPKTADLRAVGELAASRYGVFTNSQAADHGISRNDISRLIRDGAIRRARSGVFVFTAHPPTWRQAACAATTGVSAWAARETAAALHRLDGHALPPVLPELLCRHGARLEGVEATFRRSTSIPANDLTIVEGIPCTTLARTVIDLAGQVDRDVVIRMIDDIQRRGCSVRWLLQRAEALQASGRSGPSTVIDIVTRRTDGYRVPESWFERLLQRCLGSPLLASIVRQHELRDAAGRFVARFDLAIPAVRLGIEATSRAFHVGEMLERYDAGRDLRCSIEGWDIAYLGFAATRSPTEVCRDIEALVRRRCADLGVASP